MLDNANIEKSLQLNKQTRETEQSSSMLEIFDCLRTSNFLWETVKCLDTLSRSVSYNSSILRNNLEQTFKLLKGDCFLTAKSK